MPTTVSVGTSQPITTLDPRVASVGADVDAAALMYETLALADSALDTRPQLAASWTLRADRRTIDVRLRPDGRFHAGQAVRASDVIRSFEPSATDTVGRDRLRSVIHLLDGGDAFLAGRAQRIAGLSIVDSLTVALRFAPGVAPTMAIFTELPTAIRGPGASATIVNGTGPWRLARRTRGDSALVLARVRPAPGRPDSMYYGTIEAERLSALLSTGQIDCMPWVSLAGRRQLAARTDVTLQDGGQWEAQVLDVTPRRAAWHDHRARRGLAHAIDRSSYLRVLGLRSAMVTSGLLSPTGAFGDEVSPALPYDPTAARALLDSAGIRAGDTIRIFVRSGRGSDTTLGLPSLLAASLRAIDLVPVFRVHDRLDAALGSGAVDVANYAITLRNITDEAVMELFSDRSLGTGGVPIPALPRLERAYHAGPTADQRRAALRALNALVAREQPVIPLWFAAPTAAGRVTVAGCRADGIALHRFLDLRHVEPAR
ncbi:MAG: ABC transporter substrate-binding protein [Gemmatimonadaceae bacterium]|nr:ABC transporter substrate-binding protein [Gemmatimonadaceae bacterium]